MISRRYTIRVLQTHTFNPNTVVVLTQAGNWGQAELASWGQANWLNIMCAHSVDIIFSCNSQTVHWLKQNTINYWNIISAQFSQEVTFSPENLFIVLNCDVTQCFVWGCYWDVMFCSLILFQDKCQSYTLPGKTFDDTSITGTGTSILVHIVLLNKSY